MDANESDRLASLERELALLRSEVADLRDHARPSTTPPAAQVVPAALAAAAAAALPPREMKPVASAVAPPRQGRSVEELIGRYGTIAVATITVLVGAGIFLNWAIERGLLGPAARVVLGYLGAAAIAAGGVRLRMRGTREFGNVLLAIALGVVHLVCWSAGPLLHVVSPAVAVTIGFAASAVLAEFALRHDEEMLCAIGFGGAAIAPFVTNSGEGNVIVLAVYGLVVVALSAAAIGDRPWRAALNVTMGSFALLLVSVGAGSVLTTSWPGIVSRLGLLFPIAVLAALISFTHSRHRRTLIRFVGGGVMAGALLRAKHGPDLWSLGLVVGAAVLTIATLEIIRPGALEREAGRVTSDDLAATRNATLDALILPLGLFIAAITTTPSPVSAQSAAVGLIWTVLAIFMTHFNRAGPEGEKFATTAAVTALWTVPAALLYDQGARVPAMVAVGIALMLTAMRMGRKPFAGGGIVALGVASVWALALVTVRQPFVYLPFGTWATVAAVIAIVGWIAALRVARRAGFVPTLIGTERSTLSIVLVSGASVTAFLWGRAELNGAWSATASIALLVVYYAAVGTLMIWLGRTRKVQVLRVIGLGLALVAAGKALVEAFQLPNVAVRIGVFFAVSAFLIAVGYWYRRVADDQVESTSPSLPV